MNQIIITSLATDTFFNFVRLGITVKYDLLSEDFVYLKQFDATKRDITAVQMEEWINYCKEKACSAVWEQVECCEACCPPVDTTVATPAPEVAPVVEAPKPEPKKRAPKSAPVVEAPLAMAPVVEAPVAPVVEAPVVVAPVAQTPVAPVEVLVATVAEMNPVKYDKTNKEHARWLQAKLDAIDATWKSEATKVDFAKNKLIPSMHNEIVIFHGTNEAPGVVAKLAAVWASQIVAFWK